MTIINKSNKVVHIGEITILPDASATVDKQIAELSSVKALEGVGLIKIVEPKKNGVATQKAESNNEVPNEPKKSEEAVKSEKKSTSATKNTATK